MSNETIPHRRVPVLLPLPLAGVLDYAVPDGIEAVSGAIVPGAIVTVPLNGRDRVGVVWDGVASADLKPRALKPITSVLPQFRLNEPIRRFIDWVAHYTLANPGDVLAMSLRQHALAADRIVLGLRRGEPASASAALTPTRQRVWDAIADATLSAADLSRKAEVPPGIVRGMAKAGLLIAAPLPAGAARAAIQTQDAALSPEQADIAAQLCATGGAGFQVTLLEGATGSGKTEVYFEALRRCLAAGRQVLILLPEIALSAQWLRRFEQRFGFAAWVWHSELGSAQRRRTWREATSGAASVVVGARSALFLPFADLGLIIVDEEHDSAFKQEDGVVYHARDMAVVRARLSEAAVILVSATPSLETLANVESGRYRRVKLSQRFGGATLPATSAIDLRLSPPERGSFLSPMLVEELQRTLDRGDQALLFLNRRGYAPLTLCRACGHRMQCPHCTAWLVEHRLRRVLTCHHCGYARPVPTTCPQCKAEHTLTEIGPGVERIAEEAAARFPNARRLVMTSDTVPGPQAAAAAAAAVENREVDLIIGTQMVAKGWHFPGLTLVGVVDADLGLGGGDLRASERTMQLLHQVAGRAGREQNPGTVMLQTYQPEHPVLSALVAGDFDRFMREEAEQRRAGHWPPFGRLAALIVSAEHADEADEAARALGRAAPRAPGVIVLGPAPAPLAILRGRHRRRLLLRTTKDVAAQPILRRWLADAAVSRRVRIDVDVDPVSFL